MERNIDRHLFEVGFLYPRSKDKHGNPLRKMFLSIFVICKLLDENIFPFKQDSF